MVGHTNRLNGAPHRGIFVDGPYRLSACAQTPGSDERDSGLRLVGRSAYTGLTLVS
jgi:hypothetical protein